jgi:hypothetical protein
MFKSYFGHHGWFSSSWSHHDHFSNHTPWWKKFKQPDVDLNDSLAAREAVKFDSLSGEGGSEVVATLGNQLFVTNGEENRIDVFDKATGSKAGEIDLSGIDGYDGVQSVAAGNGLVAVAVDIEDGPLEAAPMLVGENGWQTEAAFTVGASLDNGYTPPGVMDGIGAIELDANTVRVYVNHELGSSDGYAFEVDGISLTGSRISYFDIDKSTLSIVDGGQAITAIYDAAGNRATDNSFTFEGKPGFERFCSGSLFEADTFGAGMGIADNIYFAGEETGGNFSGVGGGEWALDVATGEIWAIPGMGRGAWENVTQVDTGTSTHVAFILSDDTSPFDADGDGQNEAAPMFLYVGEKDASGNFLARNGLDGGKLYVWVSATGEVDPSDFNTSGSIAGSWVEVDNSQNLALADEFGANGYDEFGYPTQSNLWTQAEALGAFGFSRPEDVATNPADGAQVVIASTGRGSDFGGADQVGTIYTMQLDFTDIDNPSATTTILYDGDADPAQALRSPDNLDWADDGFIYVQEDRAVDGLFGAGAINPNDAGVVRIDPATGEVERIANIDLNAVAPFGAVEETGSTDIGRWESSGILDVSALFGRAPGTLFIADVQAHGIDDQDRFVTDGPAAQITDGNLKEGGQLVFLAAPGEDLDVVNPVTPTGPQNGKVVLYDAETLAQVGEFEVGNLPDMVTFSEDGSKIFVANEGEPSDGQDAAGGISIIDVATGSVKTFGFESFDDQVDALRDAGVRIFPGKLPSADFEPEYIAEDAANGKLYVSLQEANAVAEFDLASEQFTRIIPLGTKDHSVAGNGLDFNDRDGAIDITTAPVNGMYMPDAIATASIDGQTYILTANEGDDRGDFDEGGDAARVGDVLDGDVPGVTFDAALLAEIQALQAGGDDLSRLTISIIDGDTDGDGDIDELYSYGARSFTIFDTDGNVVFDSGDQFEQIIAANRPANAFNNDDFPSDDPDVVDENRSDNKGPEPEAIAVGQIGDKTIAAIGLERDSGIMIYDISDPENATFLQYIDAAADGNISPEVIKFIDAEDSETGTASIAVSFEVSGTSAIYELQLGKDITDAWGRSSKLEGTFGEDMIDGRDKNDRLYGLEGDDDLRGGSGNDRLDGGEGDDRMDGGWGNDKIVVGPGNDIATGGWGRDTFIFAEGIGEAVITDFGRWDKIKFDGVELASIEIDGDDVTLGLSDGGSVLLEDADFGWRLPNWFDEDLIA